MDLPNCCRTTRGKRTSRVSDIIVHVPGTYILYNVMFVCFGVEQVLFVGLINSPHYQLLIEKKSMITLRLLEALLGSFRFHLYEAFDFES